MGVGTKAYYPEDHVDVPLPPVPVQDVDKTLTDPSKPDLGTGGPLAADE